MIAASAVWIGIWILGVLLFTYMVLRAIMPLLQSFSWFHRFWKDV